MSQQSQQRLLEALGEIPTPKEMLPMQPVLSTASYSREEVVALAKINMDFLAALALPDMPLLPFPDLFKAIWAQLLAELEKPRGLTKFALGLPRGFTKTTQVKLLLLYCILYTDRSFILIIGATAGRAEHILADLFDMLSEPNVRNSFGDWTLGKEKDTQSEKVFSFRGRKIVVTALGAESSLRGINRKNLRPDVILMDDMQTRENAQSPLLSNALLEWMLGTLFKARSYVRCLFLFVGNIYPFPGSILRKLRVDSTWLSLIFGALLVDGESIWPELRSKEDLLEEFASDLAMGKPEIFLSEVLNDENAACRANIDTSKIPMEPIGLAESVPQGSYIVIDPAGRKSKSDKHAIGYFEVYDGKPLLREVTSEVMTPIQAIRTALTMAFTHNCRLIAVEAVAYQETLLFWFNYVCEQINVSGIEFVAIYPGTDSKNGRIRAMLPMLIDTDIKKAEILLSNAVRPVVMSQIAQWDPLRADNVDDILDLLVYGPRVIVTYSASMLFNTVEINDSASTAKVAQLSDNSAF